MDLPQWKPHKDSEKRQQSAIAIAEAALASRAAITPAHLREILSIAVWKYTECDGKYATRFRSEAALFTPSNLVHHEHVVPRKQLVDRMLANPELVRMILEEAIGCVVLRTEHRALAQVEKAHGSLSGWDRYRTAGIVVWDLKSQLRLC